VDTSSETETVFNVPLKPKEMEEQTMDTRVYPDSWPHGIQQLPSKEMAMESSGSAGDTQLQDGESNSSENNVQPDDDKPKSFCDNYQPGYWKDEKFGGPSIEDQNKNKIIVSYNQLSNNKIFIAITRLVEGVSFSYINFELAALEEIVNYLSKIYTWSRLYPNNKIRAACSYDLLRPHKTTHNIDVNSTYWAEEDTCYVRLSRSTLNGNVMTLQLTSHQIPETVHRLLQYHHTNKHHLKAAPLKRQGDPVETTFQKKVNQTGGRVWSKPSSLPPYIPYPCPRKLSGSFDESDPCSDRCECKISQEWVSRINKERAEGVRSPYTPSSCPFLDMMTRGVDVRIGSYYKCPYTCECNFPEGEDKYRKLDQKIKEKYQGSDC